MNVQQLVERQQRIRESEPSAVRRRVADLAATLDRAGIMQQRVLHVNEALARMAELCYTKDADGAFCNVDPVTYRLIVPAPWGRSGWRQWGLRRHEAETMRRILLTRQAQGSGRPPLFTYDKDGRSWHLNIFDYETHDWALYWLKGAAITLPEWRKHCPKA